MTAPGEVAPTGPPPEVAVVGSINLDLSLDIERFPEPGETVLGRGLARGGGGKGANQAVSAARLGRRVGLIGRVGDDGDGHQLARALADEGLDLTGVTPDPDAPTGLAVIEVDPSGENRIVVVPGANHSMTVGDLERAGPLIDGAGVVLAQLEIPVAVVEALAARPRSGRLVLNPAPALPVALDGVDIVVPNRTELALLVDGHVAATVEEVVDQLRMLSGPRSAVVTLGGDGAVVVDGLERGQPNVVEVPAQPVTAVDTTGAGDAFCGGLADALCLGADLTEAARWASRVAALAVTRPGAWSALPHRSELLS